jgi:hypothetical protein
MHGGKGWKRSFLFSRGPLENLRGICGRYGLRPRILP